MTRFFPLHLYPPRVSFEEFHQRWHFPSPSRCIYRRWFRLEGTLMLLTIDPSTLDHGWMSCTSYRDLMALQRLFDDRCSNVTMNRGDTWSCIFSRPLPVPRATDRDPSLRKHVACYVLQEPPGKERYPSSASFSLCEWEYRVTFIFVWCNIKIRNCFLSLVEFIFYFISKIG